MSEHTHEWMRVNEESLLGGYFQIGWECMTCGERRGKDTSPWELTTTGVQSSKEKLVGVHGGQIQTRNGERCKAQIYDTATKELTYLK